MNTTEILSCFLLDSKPVSCEPYGNGHINSTFLVTTEKGSRYILQRLNEEAFKDVPALMENISGIAQFLEAKAKASGGACHVLPPVQTKDGLTYVHVTDGPDSCGAGDAAAATGPCQPGQGGAGRAGGGALRGWAGGASRGFPRAGGPDVRAAGGGRLCGSGAFAGPGGCAGLGAERTDAGDKGRGAGQGALRGGRLIFARRRGDAEKEGRREGGEQDIAPPYQGGVGVGCERSELLPYRP